MTSTLDLATFRPHLSSMFRAGLGDEPAFELELIEASSLEIAGDQRDQAIRQEPFRLTFRGGSRETYLPQQTCTLTHDVLGHLEIFLVPVGPDSDGMLYEAIFN